MISDAVHAYLADLDTERTQREHQAREEALEEPWFGAFDERAHAAYEEPRPTRLARWLKLAR